MSLTVKAVSNLSAIGYLLYGAQTMGLLRDLD